MKVALVKDGKVANLAVVRDENSLPAEWLEYYEAAVVLVPESVEERRYTTPPFWGKAAQAEVVPDTEPGLVPPEEPGIVPSEDPVAAKP